MATTNERSNETNRYTDKGATASSSLVRSCTHARRGPRKKDLRLTHTQLHACHICCPPLLFSASPLVLVGRGATADAAKGTHAASQHLFFFSSSAAPLAATPRPYTWLPRSGLTRARPSGMRERGRESAAALTTVRSLAFGPIYLPIKCLRSRSRRGVCRCGGDRRRPIQLVTRATVS